MTREEAIKELSYIADEMPSMECTDWKEAIYMAIKSLEQEPCEDYISRNKVLEGKVIHQSCDGVEIVDSYAVPVEYIEHLPSIQPKPKTEVLDKIRAEIAEYGSICVAYVITDKTKTDKGIEELVRGALNQAKEQVLNIFDKYKSESEE